MKPSSTKKRFYPDQRRKIEILEELAECWNEEGIRYSVTNGLQGYPEKIGRDLDICIQADDIKNAVELTIRHLRDRGFIVLPYHLAWVYWIVGIRENEDGSIDSIQVDLFDHLQWAFSWIIEGVEEGADHFREGPFQTEYWSPVAKRLILNALARNFKTFEEKPHYLETSPGERAVLKKHFDRISGKPFTRLQEAIVDRDLGGIRREIPKFRKAVMKKSLTNLGKLIRGFHSAWLKQWCVNINPIRTAPIISIVGPDPEKLREWTSDIDQFLEHHLVFTCHQPECFSELIHQSTPFDIWWTIFRRHFNGYRKRSAIQVIQIFLNYPKENTYSKNLTIGHPLHALLPTPSFTFDISSQIEFQNRSDFLESLLSRLLAWFEGESQTAQLSIRNNG